MAGHWRCYLYGLLVLWSCLVGPARPACIGIPGCDCTITDTVDCSNAGLTEIPDFTEVANASVIILINNSISTIHSEDFTLLASTVQVIDLRRNVIREIESRAFADLVAIQTIQLSENQLSSLPDDIFDGQNIQTIDISRNTLEDVPIALRRLNSVRTLKLNDNLLSDLGPHSFEQISGVTTLDISNTGLTGFDSCALQFSGWPSLNTLYLDQNSFTDINDSYFQCITRTLAHLSMSACGIQSLERNVFINFPILKELDLSHNNFGVFTERRQPFRLLRLNFLDLSHSNITNLKRAVFKDTVINDTLYLIGNNISVIHERDFEGLEGLTKLVLSRSGIKEIRPAALRMLTNLQEIFLDQNYLGDDVVASLTGARKLHNIDLTANDLTRVPNFPISNFPDLVTLSLAHNKIQRVEARDLHGMSMLRDIVLKSNEIDFIEFESFNGTTNLTNLDLENNTLTALPDMTHLTHLLDLHVGSNRLTTLPGDLCSGSPRIQIVVASTNRITNVPSFKECRGLVHLSLDRNAIATLSPDTFDNQNKLRMIDLSRNQLVSLPPGIFESCRALGSLYLDHNSITALPDGLFNGSRLLYSLNLGFNQIEELQEGIFNLTRLSRLELNDNGIKRIHESAFATENILGLLNLSSNSLEEWDLPPQGFPDLQVLALQSNFKLLQVPGRLEIPRAKELYFTHRYHCCIWRGYEPPGLNRSADPEVVTHPTSQPVTTPPDLNLSFDQNIWEQECIDSGARSQKEIESISQFEEDFDVTVIRLPNCGYQFIENSPEGEPANVGTNSETFFEDFETANAGDDFINVHGIRFRYEYRLEVYCEPAPDPLSPCDNLIDPWFLRVAIWAIWVLAVLGNSTVLFTILAAREKIEVSQFLVCNLAFADFCIGIYLTFLAVVDVRTFGDRSFFQSALQWQLSAGCQAAGFIAVFASELSVYILVVLTLERVHTIAYAFNPNGKVKFRVAVAVVVFGWLLAIVIAALPLLPFGVNSYTNVAVCLPYLTEDLWDQFYIGFLLSLNLLGFFIILASYIYIFNNIRKSSSSASNQKNNDICVSAVKIALLIVVTFVCWAPIAVVGFLALGGISIDITVSKYLIVLVYPLNACVNPFIYAITTKQFRQQFGKVFRRSSKDAANAFPSSHPLKLQRMNVLSSDGGGTHRGASPRSAGLAEELMRLRHSRRSNSYSVQPWENSLIKSPTPPSTPQGVFMGRRASLPAGFGSTLSVANRTTLPRSPGETTSSRNSTATAAAAAAAATTGGGIAASNVNTPTYKLPFQLASHFGMAGGSGSLSDLHEGEFESPHLPERETGLTGSQISNDSCPPRRLSVVEEEPVEMATGMDGECYSAASSDSEYSDAQESFEVNVLVVDPSLSSTSTQEVVTTFTPSHHHPSTPPQETDSVRTTPVHHLDSTGTPSLSTTASEPLSPSTATLGVASLSETMRSNPTLFEQNGGESCHENGLLFSSDCGLSSSSSGLSSSSSSPGHTHGSPMHMSSVSLPTYHHGNGGFRHLGNPHSGSLVSPRRSSKRALPSYVREKASSSLSTNRQHTPCSSHGNQNDCTPVCSTSHQDPCKTANHHHTQNELATQERICPPNLSSPSENSKQHLVVDSQHASNSSSSSHIVQHITSSSSSSSSSSSPSSSTSASAEVKSRTSLRNTKSSETEV